MSRLTPTLLPLDKGLNLQTAKILAPPGSALDSLNYEQVDFQGQKRIDGYARYDGSVLPAFDDFALVPNTYTKDGRGIVFNGESVAFGQWLADRDDTYVVAVFNENALPEDAEWGKDVIADVDEHYNLVLQYTSLLRSMIESLPGPVIGLHWFRDRLYAVADLQQVAVVDAGTMTITGDLPDTERGSDYNANLGIVNPIGIPRISSVTGTNIPENIDVEIDGTNINVNWLDTPPRSKITFDEIGIIDDVGRRASWSGVVNVELWDLTWETSGVSFPTMHGLYDVLWSTLFNKFIAVGYYNSSPNTSIVGSVDGMTWTSLKAQSGDYWQTSVEAPELGRVFAYGASNSVTYTTNGTSWTTTTTNVTQGSNGFDKVAWSPELGCFVAIGNAGIYRSTNGINDWVLTSSAQGAVAGRKVIWVSELGLFVLTNASIIQTSPDGTNWTTRVSTNSPYNVWWSEDRQRLFAFIHPSPTVLRPYMTSDDGVTWISYPGPVAGDFFSDFVMKPSYSPELLGALIGRAPSANNGALMQDVGEIQFTQTAAGTSLWQSSAWSSSLGRFVVTHASNGEPNMILVSTSAY